MLCAGVPAGSGRVVMCLQSKMDHEKMGKECRDAIAEDQRRSLDDIRLHEDLSKSCRDDAKTLCTPVNPGEGRMIKCLREKRQDIAKPECRAALLRAMMSSADNYLMDRPLAAACPNRLLTQVTQDDHRLLGLASRLLAPSKAAALGEE